MKPRRWYSSPEINPHPRPSVARAFPAAVYWAFTTRTRLEQGPIIKAQPAEGGASPQRRAAVSLQPRPPRLIDAA
jgi:hypothetical protein